MVDFNSLAAMAKRLIEANGRTVTLAKLNATPDDTAKPWEGSVAKPATSAAGAVATVKMAFVPPGGGGFGRMFDVGGASADRLDQIGLLASDSLGSGVTPATIESADLIRDGDDVLRIVERHHLKPGDKSIMFALGVAK